MMNRAAPLPWPNRCGSARSAAPLSIARAAPRRLRIAWRSTACSACLKRRDVLEIEHTSMLRAETSCDPMCLRVQNALRFGCSIRWSNKRRSITELNSDSQSSSPKVTHQGRHSSKTLRSCGPAPASEIQRFAASPSRPACFVFLRNAGSVPAFAFARSSPPPRLLARGTEFISVSGRRAARSALRSDLRLKRTSGVEAATPQPHAPMNSPDPHAQCSQGARVSINLDAIA